MASKLFQRRNATKPVKASGEGFLSDREENIEEVNTDDVRLAARRKQAENPPAPDAGKGPNPFKQWSSNALIAVSETLTKLEEYATDKSIQGAVVQIAEELRSRPLAPAAPAPVVASKKKAVSIDITDGNVHVEVPETAAPVIDPIAPPVGDLGITPLPETPVEPLAVDVPAAEGVIFDGPTEDTAFEGPEDIDYPKEDWESEVSEDMTKLGYAKWVVAKHASEK